MHQWHAALSSKIDSQGPPFTPSPSVETTTLSIPNTVQLGC
jgi:hypothetical protein